MISRHTTLEQRFTDVETTSKPYKMTSKQRCSAVVCVAWESTLSLHNVLYRHTEYLFLIFSHCFRELNELVR